MGQTLPGNNHAGVHTDTGIGHAHPVHHSRAFPLGAGRYGVLTGVGIFYQD